MHGYQVGQTVVIATVVPAGYQGTYVIASVPTPTTFTYTNPNSSLVPSTTAGTVTAYAVSLSGGNLGVANTNSNNTLNVTNTATTAFNNAISGAGAFDQNGRQHADPGGHAAGPGAATTPARQRFINQGIVQVQSATSLGTAASNAYVSSGTAVQIVASGVTFTKTIFLNGTGIAGVNGGALENLSNGSNVSQQYLVREHHACHPDCDRRRCWLRPRRRHWRSVAKRCHQRYRPT